MRYFKLTVIPELLSSEDETARHIGFSQWNDHRGFVVVADNENNARLLAARYTMSKSSHASIEAWWLCPEFTTCEEIDPATEAVILANTPTG